MCSADAFRLTAHVCVHIHVQKFGSIEKPTSIISIINCCENSNCELHKVLWSLREFKCHKNEHEANGAHTHASKTQLRPIKQRRWQRARAKNHPSNILLSPIEKRIVPECEKEGKKEKEEQKRKRVRQRE